MSFLYTVSQIRKNHLMILTGKDATWERRVCQSVRIHIPLRTKTHSSNGTVGKPEQLLLFYINNLQTKSSHTEIETGLRTAHFVNNKNMA